MIQYEKSSPDNPKNTISVLKRLIFVLILVYLQNGNEASSVSNNRTISATIKLEDDQYLGYRLVTQGVDKTTFWLVHCDNDTFVQSSLCAVHLHEYSFDGSSALKKYEFSTEPRYDGYSSVLSSMKTYRLNDDKLLIAWIEYNTTSKPQVLHVGGQNMQAGSFVKFLIMDFAEYEISDFQTTEVASGTNGVDFHDLMANLDIRIGKDALDVYYLYSNNSNFAQERFHFDGKKIMGPLGRANFQIDENMVKFALYGNHTDGIQSWERFKVSDVCGLEVPCNLALGREKMYGLTASRDYVSSCKQNSAKKWDCNQRLWAGTSMFPIVFDYEPVYFMISNVYIERLLIMTGKSGPNGSVVVYLTMINVSFEPYKPVQFVEMKEKPSDLQGHFFLNEDYDFCFSMLWKTQSLGGSHNFLSKCYTRDTLSQKA